MKNKFKIILGVALLSGVVFAASITKFYGDIDMQSHKITNLATPTSNADGANKSYVDTQISSTAITLLPLSGGTMSGTINMGGKKITNLATPTATADASTKGYVDDEITATQDLIDRTSLYASNLATRVSVGATNYTDTASTNLWKGVYKRLKLSGGTMTGSINMGTALGDKYFINYLHSPTSEYQAVNKKYVLDNFLPFSGGTMTGNINLSGTATIKSVPTPVSNNDAAPKIYVDGATNAVKNYVNTQLATKLDKSGGTMSGNLNMGGYKISGLLTAPSANGDAVNKAYADTKLSLSGGTMTGLLNMNDYRIANVQDPIGNKDAATKGYVDGVINNANSYQYFALRKGSGYTPIYHLSSNTNRHFSVIVLRQFEGSITSYVENIHGIASQHYASKTWKVGETIKVPFGLGPETFVETNGTLIVKGPSGVLGNFGITAPPNGTSPFTCDMMVNGTTYAPNTSLSLNNIWDMGNRCFTFKIKNTSGRTISNAVITAPAVVQYVSSTAYTSASLYFADAGTYSVIPGTLTISSWANNMELTFKLYVIDIDNDYGFRWNFNISADGQSYDYGQFFYYVP